MAGQSLEPLVFRLWVISLGPWHSAGVYRPVFATCARLIIFGAERNDVNDACANNIDNQATLRRCARPFHGAKALQPDQLVHRNICWTVRDDKAGRTCCHPAAAARSSLDTDFRRRSRDSLRSSTARATGSGFVAR